MPAPRILLTRPEPRGAAFAEGLRACGWDVQNWPLTEIRPTGASPDITGAQAVIYTSRTAAEMAGALGLAALPAYCVGSATMTAARAAGHETTIAGDGDAAALAGLLTSTLQPTKGALLHVRGRHVAGDLAAALTGAGYAFREHIAYEAHAAAAPPADVAADIAAGRFDAFAFFSPRAGAIFAALTRPEWRDGLAAATAFAISGNAAAALGPLGFGRIAIAEAPNAAALRAAICGAA